MRLRMDPAQMAELGIDEAVAIDLPEGFEGYTPDQRRIWAAAAIEAIVAEMFEDLGATVAGR